ncbi:hypothetical protein J2Z37_004117 [Ammoniphilus resinae]|uniref:Uncharacterized protein n=1 Tax=Ammoniphilus resinae TaxID=861532 RepID=A0ABS4GV02_9BACL|nr:hypothetical protein [Ammoniphilus resinae]
MWRNNLLFRFSLLNRRRGGSQVGERPFFCRDSVLIRTHYRFPPCSVRIRPGFGLTLEVSSLLSPNQARFRTHSRGFLLAQSESCLISDSLSRFPPCSVRIMPGFGLTLEVSSSLSPNQAWFQTHSQGFLLAQSESGPVSDSLSRFPPCSVRIKPGFGLTLEFSSSLSPNHTRFRTHSRVFLLAQSESGLWRTLHRESKHPLGP